MRQTPVATLIGFILLASSALAQTTTPGTTPAPAPAPSGGIADWWWVILLVILVAAAVWYFGMRRRGPNP